MSPVQVALSKIRSVRDNSLFWYAVSCRNFERCEIGYSWVTATDAVQMEIPFACRAKDSGPRDDASAGRPTSPACSHMVNWKHIKLSFAVNPRFYNRCRKVAKARVYASFAFAVKSDGSMRLSVIIVLYFPPVDVFCLTIRQSRNVPCLSISRWYSATVIAFVPLTV